MKAVGAHIYAGGFTLGVRKYFDVLAHLEDTGYGEDVIRLNWPELVVRKPYSNWPEIKNVDFVFGNPPCAPFSIMPSMKGKNWETDKRLDHTLNVFNLLTSIRPKVLAIESVSQAWTQGGSFVMSLAAQAEEQGYSTTELLHDSQYLGLPQRRKRVFHIFHNIEVAFDKPDYDHVVTLGEAISRVPDVGPEDVSIPSKLKKYYYNATPGESLSKSFDRMNLKKEVKRDKQGRVKGRPRFITQKVRLDAPAPTLIGGYNLLHPGEPRFLYLHELVEIMGYPQDYRWPTIDYNKVSHYLSRGINPLAAEWLAKGVHNSILNNVKVTKPTFKLLDWRTKDGYERSYQTTLL